MNSRRRQDTVDSLILELAKRGDMPRGQAHECPYMPDRDAIEEGCVVDSLDPETYHELMDIGYRRSGRVLYRPRCPRCSACQSIRIPVDEFAPSRSQRRAWRKNQDLNFRMGPPTLTDEKIDLYQRYLDGQHPETKQADDVEGLEEFLYTSCVNTIEVTYRLPDGKLIAVSVLDMSSTAASSMYHFFDPDESKRSLGVYSVVNEIELCKRLDLTHYYLGFWIRGCRTMDYKARYFPHEILIDEAWYRAEPSADPPPTID